MNMVSNEQLNNIKILLEQLFTDNYQNNNNDKPLYLIDTILLYKMKMFIEPYIQEKRKDSKFIIK